MVSLNGTILWDSRKGTFYISFNDSMREREKLSHSKCIAMKGEFHESQGNTVRLVCLVLTLRQVCWLEWNASTKMDYRRLTDKFAQVFIALYIIQYVSSLYSKFLHDLWPTIDYCYHWLEVSIQPFQPKTYSLQILKHIGLSLNLIMAFFRHVAYPRLLHPSWIQSLGQ